MKKHLFILCISMWMALVFAPGCLSQERPNFVWIVSEDNSAHYMKLFDENGISTPRIEELAADGITFLRAFSNAPVCSVARSTLISSCYAPRTGTQFHRKQVAVEMPDGVEMFPAILRESGYYTTNNSKEDFNYVRPGDVWDESSRQAHWKNRENGQPFFHMESHPVSHESSLHFPEELADTYQPVTAPADVVLSPRHPDTPLFRFTQAYYMDRILAVDSIVGQVVRELEEAGLLESTFVFYFGDHGGVLPGSKGYVYESGLHVPLVVRIPGKFRHLVSPGRGTTTEGFVSFTDFGPTVLELAGCKLPGMTDGKPFMGPSVAAGEMEQRNSAWGYADRFDEKTDQVRSLRKGNMKYIRNYQPFNVDGLQNNYRYRCAAYRQWKEMYLEGVLDPVQSLFFEPREPEALYDLSGDPYETVNLASDPRYRNILMGMRKELQDWVRELPDLSFFPEPVLVREALPFDPVAFGERQRERISALADIADLSLLPFNDAAGGISEALGSEDPLKVYWGLIVCSCFGEEALSFAGTATDLCSYPDLLVRTRAAEFLGICQLQDPAPVILGSLEETRDGPEALLILNSLVLLRDWHGWEFDLSGITLSRPVMKNDGVARRLAYLNPIFAE